MRPNCSLSVAVTFSLGPRGPQSPARQPGGSSGPSQLLSFGVGGGWGLRGEKTVVCVCVWVLRGEKGWVGVGLEARGVGGWELRGERGKWVGVGLEARGVGG